MDKNDFDVDFDFDKDMGFDPEEFLGSDDPGDFDMSQFDEDDLKKTKEFIDTLKTVEKVEVLPDHKLGIQEWERLGIPYKLEGIDPPTEEQQKLAKSILEN